MAHIIGKRKDKLVFITRYPRERKSVSILETPLIPRQMGAFMVEYPLFRRWRHEEDPSLNIAPPSYGSILTTRNGFSCGGISPVYLHENGAFAIGEECGGGFCSIYMQYDAYGNLNRASSPVGTCTKDSVSIDEARLTVCDFKMNFPFDGTSYDYSSLFDTAMLRQLIEAHYQSA